MSYSEKYVEQKLVTEAKKDGRLGGKVRVSRFRWGAGQIDTVPRR